MSDHCPRCNGTKIQMHWCDGGGLAYQCERCNERWGDDLHRFDKALAGVLEREQQAKSAAAQPPVVGDLWVPIFLFADRC